MKNLSYVQTHFLPACLALLLFTGCIKDPAPETPPREDAPEWLLTKYTQVDDLFGPDYGNEHRFHKEVHEYQYDEHYKPILHRRYQSAASGDTVNLNLVATDTLYYDSRLRPVRVISDSPGESTYIVKTFSYNGNDTVPAIAEHSHYVRGDSATPIVQYSYNYEYRGDSVVLERADGAPDPDTYLYEQGKNYTQKCSGLEPCIPTYTSYDDYPNAARFLNLDHGLALELPDNQPSPLISPNNWVKLASQDAKEFRSMVYDTSGLLVHSSSPDAYNGNTTIRRSYFEYRKTE